MMEEVELLVRLIIPDNVAITALRTLQGLGYNIQELKREEYYKFRLKENAEAFMEKIGTVDILVNANKNRYKVKNAKEPFDGDLKILVKDTDDGTASLLSVLKNRLGFKEVKGMERGVLWTIKPKDKKLAEDITKELLYNPHYQEYEILN